MRARDDGWSDDRTARLAREIQAGASAGRAGKSLQVSRCAAGARAWRMGWQFGKPLSDEQCCPPFKVVRGNLSKKQRALLPKPEPRDEMISVSSRFDPETYAEISALAAKGDQSKAQTVRELVEWGLEAARGDAR